MLGGAGGRHDSVFLLRGLLFEKGVYKLLSDKEDVDVVVGLIVEWEVQMRKYAFR